MLIQQTIGITLASGAGNGVASNKRVTTTKTNVNRIVFNVPGTNTGNVRVGHGVYNEATKAFAAPTSPLTDVTALVIIPKGTNYTFEADGHLAARGELFDLSQFYVQGDNANDVVQVNYQFARPAAA